MFGFEARMRRTHPRPARRARAVPIYQTTSCVFPDANPAGSILDLEPLH
jgi:O-acetylhomoserine/O-acetylserine sulfhydrylase-like pyridoxal-dependent enzyme